MENQESKVIEYYLAGNGQQACARYAHCSLRKVKEYLIKNNIHIRNKSEAGHKAAELGKKCQPKLDYTPQQEQIALDCYVNQKRGQAYCCQQAGCNVKVLKEILKNNNVAIRNFSEAASLSNINRAKDKNKEYFDIESPNMAWILGFLASDGNVSKSDNCIKIALSTTDIEILERIREEIQIENEIQTYETYDGFSYSSLAWSCQEHKQALAKYSIVPNKTFILQPPYELDKKYWIDYIRGYFDGDGSINILSSGALRWQVCSATPEILQFIVDYFYNEYNIPKVNLQQQQREKNILYTIQYSTNSTKAIYSILYGTSSTLFLARKKKHYEEILTK